MQPKTKFPLKSEAVISAYEVVALVRKSIQEQHAIVDSMTKALRDLENFDKRETCIEMLGKLHLHGNEEIQLCASKALHLILDWRERVSKLKAPVLKYFGDKFANESIELLPKPCGKSEGMVVQIGNKCKYFVKMHCNGLLSERRTYPGLQIRPFKMKELYFYKVMEHLGIGSKAVLFGENPYFSFIGTLDVTDKNPNVKVFRQFLLTEQYKKLVQVLEHQGTEAFETEAPQYIEGMTNMDLFAYLVGIMDVHSDNFALCSVSLGDFVILDFNLAWKASPSHIVQAFKRGDCCFRNDTSDPLWQYVIRTRDWKKRLSTAQALLQQMAPKLESALDVAKQETEEFVSTLPFHEALTPAYLADLKRIRDKILSRFHEMHALFKAAE